MADRKPVLYLDVDGVLLRFPDRAQFASESDLRAYYSDHPNGGPPNRVGEFLAWAHAHFRVRWLSAWACSGGIGTVGRDALIHRLGVAPWMIVRVGRCLGWQHSKCEGIDWTEHAAGVEWFWLDDDAHLMEREVAELRARDAFDRLITVDTSVDADALTTAMRVISERLNLGEPINA